MTGKLGVKTVEDIITIRENKYGLKDYSGSVINGVKILGRVFIKNLFSYSENKMKPIYKYNCECLKCGKTFLRNKISMSSNTLICNCDRVLKNNVSAINLIYKEYMRQAKFGRARILDFSLNKEHFTKLITDNCFYCGLEPSTLKSTVTYNFYYNGIDRVDSNKGYTEDNCVTCCFNCNKAKWALTEKDFLNHIERIYEYQKNKSFKE